MHIYGTILSFAVVILQATAGPTIKLQRFASGNGLSPHGHHVMAACAYKPVGEDTLKPGFCKTWPNKDVAFDQFKFHGKVMPYQHCQLLIFEKRGCYGSPIAIVVDVTQKNAGYNCMSVLQDTSARSAMLQCDPSISGDEKHEEKKEKLHVENPGMPMPAITATTGGTEIRTLGWAVPTTTEVLTYSLAPGLYSTLTTTHLAPSRSISVPVPDNMQSLVDASVGAADAQPTESYEEVLNSDW